MIRFIYALAVILGLCAAAHAQTYYWGSYTQPSGVHHVFHHAKHHHKHFHGGHRHRVAHVAPLPTAPTETSELISVRPEDPAVLTNVMAENKVSVNRTVVEPIQTPHPKRLKKERAMETVVSYLPQAFMVFGVLAFAYYGWTKVVAPVAIKGLSLVTVVKSDFATVEKRVGALEMAVGFNRIGPAAQGAPVTSAPAATQNGSSKVV